MRPLPPSAFYGGSDYQARLLAFMRHEFAIVNGDPDTDEQLRVMAAAWQRLGGLLLEQIDEARPARVERVSIEPRKARGS